MVRRSFLALPLLIPLSIPRDARAAFGDITADFSLGPAAHSCGQQFTTADEADFEAHLQHMGARSRTIASSEAMLECLTEVLVEGGEPTFGPERGISSDVEWGPYCLSCPGSIDASTSETDPFRDSLSAQGPQGKRRILAQRAWLAGQTSSAVIASCRETTETWGAAAHSPELRTGEHAEEIMYFSSSKVAEILGLGLPPASPSDVRYRELGALTWHEILHDRGFEHAGSGVLNHRRQIPHTYAACMSRIAFASDRDCTQTCGGDEFPIVRQFRLGSSVDGSFISSCECLPDPAVPRAPTSSQLPFDFFFDTYPIAVDSVGNVYRTADNTVWQTSPRGQLHFVGSTPRPVVALHAGADRVYVQTERYMYEWDGNQGWAYQTLVYGAAEFAVDDLGTLYKSTLNGIDRHRLGDSGWSWTGTPAETLYAGGDVLYATSLITDNINRRPAWLGVWEHAGGDGAGFVVDAMGVAFGISPSGNALYRYDGFGAWDWVGAGTEAVVAGRRVARLDSSGAARELEADGSWQVLGSDVLDVRAGGNTVVGLTMQGVRPTWVRFDR